MDAGGFDRNQEATCYVGDLDGQVDEAILWELCVQAGRPRRPVARTRARIPLRRAVPSHS